jgi:putative Mg2+ transporter-C (MgtC) family protein
MPLNIGWWEIALRLALTVAAGILIGINRSEHGHAAGLRTTLLVCLAASLSMLQVNLLLPMTGKTSSSFAVMDLMRLPWAFCLAWVLLAPGQSCAKTILCTA